MSKVKGLFERVSFGLGEIASWAALTITVMITTDVILRYFFRQSVPANEELTRLLMVLLIFFGLGLSQERKVHIRVDFFMDKMPPMLRQYWEIICHFCALIFISLLFYDSIGDSLDSFKKKEFYPGEIRVPVYPGRIAITIGCGLMIIALIKDIKNGIDNLSKKSRSDSSKTMPIEDIGTKLDK